ncbi:MFS transporter, partial [bacterium]|nr:MFS transporter [bacterium]
MTERARGLFGLFRSRNFSVLWAGSLMSQMGDHLNLMALTALIFAVSAGTRTSGLEFSKILLLASAPVLLFGPISGVYADRVNRKTMMIASDFIRAALVVAVPFVAGSMGAVYVLVFLVFTVNRFYLSAKSAALPQIVPPGKLMEANSLLNVSVVAAMVIGPLGGGLLVERYGFAVGFAADSATYVISGVLMAFITLRSISEIAAERAERAEHRRALGETARHALSAHSRAEFVEEAARLGHEIAAPIEEEVEVIGSTYHRIMRDLKEGLGQMRGNPLVIYSTISSSSVMFISGVVLIALPVLVRNEFHMGTAGLGQLFSLAGVGMLVGSLAIGRFFAHAERRAIIAVSFSLAGAVIVLMATAPSMVTLRIGIFLTGLFIAPANVACDTILQEQMPGASIGKAFGLRDMASKAAFGVAGILSGFIVDIIGPRQLMAITGFASIFYAGISPFLYADTSRLNLL